MKSSPRLWRVRRDHQHIDAEVVAEGAEGVELRFVFNGALLHARRAATRAEAAAEADRVLHHLLRAGWSTHW